MFLLHFNESFIQQHDLKMVSYPCILGISFYTKTRFLTHNLAHKTFILTPGNRDVKRKLDLQKATRFGVIINMLNIRHIGKIE